jgi:hypothetical protein
MFLICRLAELNNVIHDHCSQYFPCARVPNIIFRLDSEKAPLLVGDGTPTAPSDFVQMFKCPTCFIMLLILRCYLQWAVFQVGYYYCTNSRRKEGHGCTPLPTLQKDH